MKVLWKIIKNVAGSWRGNFKKQILAVKVKDEIWQ